VSRESSEDREDIITDAERDATQVSSEFKVGKRKNVAVNIIDEGSSLRRFLRAKQGLIDDRE
jgi:hypothetical protein